MLDERHSATQLPQQRCQPSCTSNTRRHASHHVAMFLNGPTLPRKNRLSSFSFEVRDIPQSLAYVGDHDTKTIHPHGIDQRNLGRTHEMAHVCEDIQTGVRHNSRCCPLSFQTPLYDVRLRRAQCAAIEGTPCRMPLQKRGTTKSTGLIAGFANWRSTCFRVTLLPVFRLHPGTGQESRRTVQSHGESKKWRH